MKNIKKISKIATFFGVVSTIFTILSAIVTYFLIQITYTDVPTEYFGLSILTTILPYLFLAVLSFVVAAMTKSTEDTEEVIEEAVVEEETLPPTQPEEAVS
jgi:hypothetical protein